MTVSTELRFDPESGLYEFETEALRGALQPGDVRHGVRRLVHKPSDVSFIHPAPYSALNLFRIFGTNVGLGQPRTLPCTHTVQGNVLEITWAWSDSHQGGLVARYEVGSSWIDLSITVQAMFACSEYEILVSNYFEPALRPYVYLASASRDQLGRLRLDDDCELVGPAFSDVYSGVGLVFPRDSFAARLCVDGRWNRRELEAPTTQWAPLRPYAVPVAFEADLDRRVATVLMARPSECFAVSTGYHDDLQRDAWKKQNPLYLSLFGDSLLPGDTRMARMRMAFTSLDDAMSQPLALYQAWISDGRHDG